jgi:hypothetical protein
MSQITDKIGSGLRKAGDVLSDAGKSTSNTITDGYNKATSHHSSGHSVNLKNNSGFSQDAKDLARDAERMKDNAMRDADRRFR